MLTPLEDLNYLGNERYYRFASPVNKKVLIFATSAYC